MSLENFFFTWNKFSSRGFAYGLPSSWVQSRITSFSYTTYPRISLLNRAMCAARRTKIPQGFDLPLLPTNFSEDPYLIIKFS